MRSLPRALAFFVAVAVLPLLRAFEGDAYEALELVASEADAVSRPNPDSVVANREDKARRMFRMRDGANERELSCLDGDDAPFVFDVEAEPAAVLGSQLRERGPPTTTRAVAPPFRSTSARGPPV
jgi:hypothetical protein